MTIVIPDARTPAGVRCWVREFDGYAWLPRVYAGCGQDQYRVRTDGIGQEHWRLCRLDDPETGWVENTGTAPDAKGPIELKLRSGSVPSIGSVGTTIGVRWRIDCVSSDITHWRYPRETKEPEMKQQQTLMQFDPATGVERPYPSHAEQWREWHGGTAWLFDPWTGRRRDARDVGSDVHGLLIVPAGTLGMDMGGGCSEKDNVACA